MADRVGHTSISMPSRCVALAIREFLDGRPPTNQIVSEWESHVCRMDGPEFVRPDELETNAREIVGDNEEDVRLTLRRWRLLEIPIGESFDGFSEEQARRTSRIAAIQEHKSTRGR
ncbi:hypothetical protein V2G26_018125 [Clonostachys chloroleuca]